MKTLFKTPRYEQTTSTGARVWTQDPAASGAMRRNCVPLKCTWRPDLSGSTLVDQFGYGHQFNRPGPKTATGRAVREIGFALVNLRQARSFLRTAGASKSAAYVQRAIKSTEGAQRHAERMATQGASFAPGMFKGAKFSTTTRSR